MSYTKGPDSNEIFQEAVSDMTTPPDRFEKEAQELACKAAETIHRATCELINHESESCCYHIACMFKDVLSTIPLAELLRDKARLEYAILYPASFCHLMQIRAHGGFVEQELEQGRLAIDSAMQKEQS